MSKHSLNENSENITMKTGPINVGSRRASVKISTNRNENPQKIKQHGNRNKSFVTDRRICHPSDSAILYGIFEDHVQNIPKGDFGGSAYIAAEMHMFGLDVKYRT